MKRKTKRKLGKKRKFRGSKPMKRMRKREI